MSTLANIIMIAFYVAIFFIFGFWAAIITWLAVVAINLALIAIAKHIDRPPFRPKHKGLPR